MIVDPTYFIVWSQFVKLGEIRNLPLNEQVKRYSSYNNEFTFKRAAYLNWLLEQSRGPSSNSFNYLLQEDGKYLLQEDNFKIKI